MKKLFYIAAAALTFALAGCTQDPAISVDENVKVLYASAEGEAFTFTLNANREWIAEILPGSNAAVTVDPDLGVGTQEVSITVAENLSEATLETTVRFTCGTAPAVAYVDVKIKQAGLTSVKWGGVDYRVKKMKDDNFWFVDNLRYIPEGLTPCKDLNNVTAGIYCPIAVNAEKTGAELTDNEDVIKANGYLYQAETALGLAVGSITTVEQAVALEGAQGICPPGWHLPTFTEIVNLVGKSVDATTKTDAPYYDGANGSIQKLNEDGFNMESVGLVSINDNTKTSAALNCWSKNYPDKIYSSMFCGSTCAKASTTYYTKDDPSSGIKNLLFYGFMPMTNKATEAEYTCNGTKVAYKCAGPVRCVKTKLSGTPL